MSALPVCLSICLSHVPPLRSWAQSQEQLADAMVTLKELLSAGTPFSPCLVSADSRPGLGLPFMSRIWVLATRLPQPRPRPCAQRLVTPAWFQHPCLAAWTLNEP